MKYPAMNKRPRQAVVAPDFSGGLNLRDGISQIADNQLTDCLNMWFKDGALRTRPGIEKFKEDSEKYSVGGTLSLSKTTIEYREHDVKKIINGESCKLISAIYRGYETKENKEELCEKTMFYGFVGKSEISIGWPITLDADFFDSDYFVVGRNDEIYIFFSHGRVYKIQEDNSPEALYADDYYIPTVLTNCVPRSAVYSGVSGDAKESYNILSDYYKVVYSSVDKSKDTSAMTYNLLYPVIKMAGDGPEEFKFYDYSEGRTFSADLTTTDDFGNPITVHHSVVLKKEKDEKWNGEGRVVEKNAKEDGLRLSVSLTHFSFIDKDEIVVMAKKEDYILNNLTITAPRPTSDKSGIFNSTKSIWFGGGAGGLSGGTRLFLCGNPKEKNIVRWSHRDNLLYWPENNWFEVGDQSQAVTGFGKQENMLVIFKENETYYTQYNQNTDITAEDLSTQVVIDYNAASVYFPLIQLNPNIGCDCPGTIQLCRNRLVWANSNGKVYSLVSANNYSERTIYEVGEMVFNRLCKEYNLKTAKSCDWQGHYVLSVNNHLYLMDYNSSGYQYAYSYQKQEDGNARIPWYYWELPNFITDYLITSISETMFLICSKRNITQQTDGREIDYYITSLKFNNDLNKDTFYTVDDISSNFQTKLFDFNAPRFYKNVDSVGLTLQNNGGAPIRVTFITDTGIDEHIVSLDGADTSDFSPASLKSIILHPCIRSYERFGVRLECDGPLAVDGMTLTYRILGGVR